MKPITDDARAALLAPAADGHVCASEAWSIAVAFATLPSPFPRRVHPPAALRALNLSLSALVAGAETWSASLGQHHVGVEHVLLALLDHTDDEPLRQALLRLVRWPGVHDDLVEAVERLAAVFGDGIEVVA